MNLREAVTIVQLLHNAYPQDRKATKEELAQRAETYSISMADYDFETVRKAACHLIKTSKWYPTTKEILDSVSWVRMTDTKPKAEVSPIPKLNIREDKVDEYLEVFCEWIGFGCEPNDDADLGQFLPYEQ